MDSVIIIGVTFFASAYLLWQLFARTLTDRPRRIRYPGCQRSVRRARRI